MNPNVLIIGGTRFIGKAIVKLLAKNGYIVHVLHRGFHPLDLQMPNIIEHYGDARNPLEYRQILKKNRIDFIIHTIAYSPEDIEALLTVQKTEQIPMIVISTGQVYLVTVKRKIPFTEEDYSNLLMHAPEDPDDFAQWEYGILKRNMEDTLTEWFEKYNIPSFTVRSPVVQGRKDYSLRLYSYIKRLQDDYPLLLPFDGDTPISHIWVEDLARAVLQIMRKGFSSRLSMNISMNERLQLTEVIGQMCSVLKISKPVFMPSLFPQEDQDILLKASPYSGKWVSVLNAEKFRKHFEWEPTPFEEWFPDIVEYQFKHFKKHLLTNYQNRKIEYDIFLKHREAGNLTEIPL